jgi:hypothetical protein
VTATNLGPNDATGVQVTDPVPAGLTFVSASASQGTYTSGTGLWAIGALVNGASATLQLAVTVNGTTPVTNTATRTAGTPTDFDPANDSASSIVTGSTTPGLPNTGVPRTNGLPLGNWLPWLLLVIVLVGVTLPISFRRRRRGD